MAEPATGEVATAPVVGSSPSYFIRLGKLSSKVQERALEQSLVRARCARDTTYATITQITSTLDLLENARSTLAAANHQLGGAPEQLLQRWKEWQEKQPKDGQVDGGKMDGPKDQTAVGSLKVVMGMNVLGELYIHCQVNHS